MVFTTPVIADRALRITDINLVNDGKNLGKALELTVRLAKTNQSGPPTILRIPTEQKSNICCVRAIEQFLIVRPNISGFLFCHANGQPLTRYQFTSVLNRSIRQLGLSLSCYKSHSFRIGRATDLAKYGVSGDVIKTMGRWSSSVYKRYIRGSHIADAQF